MHLNCIFRAPKKPRTYSQDCCIKPSSESCCKSSGRNTSAKENVSMKKNCSTKNSGKGKEIIVLTLGDEDNDDDEEEKQEGESDDSESPFPALNIPERVRSCFSSRVQSRKALDAAAHAQTQGKSCSLGSTYAATTSSYFSAAAEGPKINLSNRRPKKCYKGSAQDASYTATDRRRGKTKIQHVLSLDIHKKPQANDPIACNILSVNSVGTEALHGAAITKDQRDSVGSKDGSNTAADNESMPVKSVNIKEKLIGAADTEEQVVDSDCDDYSCPAPSVRQGRLVATLPNDEEEEEYNIDTFPVDPFLAELEKSVCSEHEKLCPCCKHIVPATGYSIHLRLCFGKYQYSHRGSGKEEASGDRRRGRSAAINQTKKSAVEGNSSTGDGEVSW